MKWYLLVWAVILVVSTGSWAQPRFQDDVYEGPGAEAFKPHPDITVTDLDYQFPRVTGQATGQHISVAPATDHFADVTIFNSYTYRYHLPLNLTFELSEITINIAIDAGSGDIPDIYRVTTSPGFYAIPEEITLRELESGIVEIHRTPMF